MLEISAAKFDIELHIFRKPTLRPRLTPELEYGCQLKVTVTAIDLGRNEGTYSHWGTSREVIICRPRDDQLPRQPSAVISIRSTKVRRGPRADFADPAPDRCHGRPHCVAAAAPGHE